jgi:SAM-dependent methyltransferase
MEYNFELALKKAITASQNRMGQNDLFFLRRIYNEGLDKYVYRLKGLCFTGHENVLDAGCGFGQWALALASINKFVECVDVSATRLQFLNDLVSEIGASNVKTRLASIEELPYENDTFDAIFSYSTLYYTDHSKSLKEFQRVLKPGGRLYVCTNGLGWYIYNIATPHKPANDHDPRVISMDAIANTINILTGGNRNPKSHFILQSHVLIELLNSMGFSHIKCGAEGTLTDSKEAQVSNFISEYQGHEAVYEVIATKGGDNV